ncbi:ATP-binding protein [Nonomuraea sp. NPDC050310]|uniref:ATP-binding protein n=1 Tax=unclassified Nonomuraea TaxID=2593643 RepID=UPI0033C94CFD
MVALQPARHRRQFLRVVHHPRPEQTPRERRCHDPSKSATQRCVGTYSHISAKCNAPLCLARGSGGARGTRYPGGHSGGVSGCGPPRGRAIGEERRRVYPGESRSWAIHNDLGELRDRVRGCAIAAGLPQHRQIDLVLAVSEAMANVLEHAGGQGRVRVSQDADFLTVEISDNAGRLTGREVPRERPGEGATGGWGLWLMGSLCDEVAIEGGEGHSSVRLRMRRPA